MQHNPEQKEGLYSPEKDAPIRLALDEIQSVYAKYVGIFGEKFSGKDRVIAFLDLGISIALSFPVQTIVNFIPDAPIDMQLQVLSDYQANIVRGLEETKECFKKGDLTKFMEPLL